MSFNSDKASNISMILVEETPNILAMEYISAL